MLKLLCGLLVCVSGATFAAPSVEVGFSSGKDGHSAQTMVLHLINGAHKSIEMMAYEFKASDIAAALDKAAERGVKVLVVIDHRANKANKLSLAAVTDATSHGVAIRVDSHYHIQHDKVMIVDGRTLETGSFNYTPTAEKANSENILVLRHVPRVIKLYQEHFITRWEYGVPYQKGDLA
ncbi:phospholipase D family protein [Buttiauxella noackiae]|uniref:phospholipase D family nuclease n=1 Tax=Buttiauxella noackiae TaxID=82992 RepID=UPI0035A59AD4